MDYYSAKDQITNPCNNMNVPQKHYAIAQGDQLGALWPPGGVG